MGLVANSRSQARPQPGGVSLQHSRRCARENRLTAKPMRVGRDTPENGPISEGGRKEEEVGEKRMGGGKRVYGSGASQLENVSPMVCFSLLASFIAGIQKKKISMKHEIKPPETPEGGKKTPKRTSAFATLLLPPITPLFLAVSSIPPSLSRSLLS